MSISVSLKGLSEAKPKSEKKLLVKISQNMIFDAKLRFAFLASLRSAIYSEIEVDNLLVTLPEKVKTISWWKNGWTFNLEKMARFGIIWKKAGNRDSDRTLNVSKERFVWCRSKCFVRIYLSRRNCLARLNQITH